MDFSVAELSNIIVRIKIDETLKTVLFFKPQICLPLVIIQNLAHFPLRKFELFFSRHFVLSLSEEGFIPETLRNNYVNHRCCI